MEIGMVDVGNGTKKNARGSEGASEIEIRRGEKKPEFRKKKQNNPEMTDFRKTKKNSFMDLWMTGKSRRRKSRN